MREETPKGVGSWNDLKLIPTPIEGSSGTRCVHLVLAGAIQAQWGAIQAQLGAIQAQLGGAIQAQLEGAIQAQLEGAIQAR